MAEIFSVFEKIVRQAREFSEARTVPSGGTHAFDDRNIHPGLPQAVRDLFDNGHYSQATFEAFKFIDKEIQRHSGRTESGFALMMKALTELNPPIQLTPLMSTSQRDEQKGFQFLFAGSILAIRNPRGHEVSIPDTPGQCLDHLSLASLLLRRLEESNFLCKP